MTFANWLQKIGKVEGESGFTTYIFLMMGSYARHKGGDTKTSVLICLEVLADDNNTVLYKAFDIPCLTAKERLRDEE